MLDRGLVEGSPRKKTTPTGTTATTASVRQSESLPNDQSLDLSSFLLPDNRQREEGIRVMGPDETADTALQELLAFLDDCPLMKEDDQENPIVIYNRDSDSSQGEAENDLNTSSSEPSVATGTLGFVFIFFS